MITVSFKVSFKVSFEVPFKYKSECLLLSLPCRLKERDQAILESSI